MSGQDVPVLLLGFNRPDKVAAVLEPLRAVGPRRVFFAVDGPRAAVELDRQKCEETALAFHRGIDWPCEVEALVREQNLGCRAAVSGAVSWVFEKVDRAVILEDDCVIEPSFLGLCATLLERHADDPKVMHIAAANFQCGEKRSDADYYGSKYAHCWGWATWRRAWAHYLDDLTALAAVVQAPLEGVLHGTEDERSYWQIIYDRCQRGEVDSWAYRWLFSCWKQGGMTLIPNLNQVTNLGFAEDGTHTRKGDSGLATPGLMRSFSPPKDMAINAEADEHTFRTIFCPPLSPSEKQVFQHRIRHLKEELKRQKDEVSRLKAELKDKKSQPWWRR